MSQANPQNDPRARLEAAVEHLGHVLPGQAPILHFVHHNTLHGYQHLPFPEALAAAERLTGIHGYLPEAEFRRFYAQGRILDEDLNAALAEQAELQPDAEIGSLPGHAIRRREVYHAALVHGLEPLTPSQLTWKIEELKALERFQDDVPPTARQRLLESYRRGPTQPGPLSEQSMVRDLWDACLAVLDLGEFVLHPEELLDLSVHQAEELLARARAMAESSGNGAPSAHAQMRAQAHALLERCWADVGDGTTLRGLVLSLTGFDALNLVRPTLIRYAAAQMDEGLAAWHSPDRAAGLYAAWRKLAPGDLGHLLADSADWRTTLAGLPDASVDAALAELDRLGLPEDRWAGYLLSLIHI